MGAPTGPYRRSDRLRQSRDFRRVSRRAHRASNAAFVMLCAEAGPDSTAGGRRLGISASRKVGNAVVRNRLKRCVREWFRESRHRLPTDIDIVVIARAPAAGLNGKEIADSLGILADRIARVGGVRRSQT